MITYVTELNTENYEEKIKSSEIVIVDIWAPWCGPCKALSPIIDQVAAEMGERILVGKLNADENGELCKSLEVRNIPTLLFYKNGEISERTTGMKMKKDIMAIVNKLSQTETTF